MVNRFDKEYYVGLDIGTDSVGWAVSDPEYRILKSRGQKMIGIHLFDSGETAANRRGFRTSRRRYDRKKNRIVLLQELFSKEIAAVDPGFFQRLNDSRFREEDKEVHQKNTLFFDEGYTDREYHRDFPTIYHLRMALIEDTEDRHDIRLLYLAIAHILKKRGHFLFEGHHFDSSNAFQNSLDAFIEHMNLLLEETEVHISCDDIDGLKAELKSRTSVKKKKEALMALFGIAEKHKRATAFMTLLAGGSTNLSILFDDASLKEEDCDKITFSDKNYSENEGRYLAVLGDRMDCITAAKNLYDWAVLADILQECTYLSEAKIASFDKHKEDLKLLKEVVKAYCSQEEYRALFHSKTNKTNYCAYIGKSCAESNESVCSREDFYKSIKKTFSGKCDESDYRIVSIFNELGKGTFLPKQAIGENGIIPYQLHLQELEAILKHAEKHFPFLQKKDENGISVSQKIISIMTFRIPYYVGPLNDAHKNENDRRSHCWIVKKEAGAIRPWNFEQKVDLEKSGENFIRRMTNKCTYLVGADVLPKDSLLYSRFMVLNEINNLRVNEKEIAPEIKQGLFKNVYMRQKSVTLRRIKDYLLSVGAMQNSDELSGIDGNPKAALKAYYDFGKILDSSEWDDQLIEQCILNIVLFSGEKKMIKSRVKRIFAGKISGEKLERICKLKYSGWGRLSKEFLTELYHVDPRTGEAINIISAMYQTNDNLMQILSRDWSFSRLIDEYNCRANDGITSFSYDAIVEPLYCSPAVKRGIWRALVIVKEIEKVLGNPPRRIFVEMARGPEEKKRTVSRKKKLVDLYKSCGRIAEQLQREHDIDVKELGAKLEKYSDSDLRRDKLYLYFTQMGKCMYSGEAMNLSDVIHNDKLYDIDHIYPQSLTKDDSLDNRVLVKRTLNEEKADIYPIPNSLRTKTTTGLWRMLLERDLIGKAKYTRLMRTRTEPLSEKELAGFISRQLVETRQSTKAIANALQTVYADEKTEIVFVKARNVSQFRQEQRLTENGQQRMKGSCAKDAYTTQDPLFVKCREVNDLHHAKDAYLNIVVGNVYHTKFTSDPANFIKHAKPRSYSLNRMYDYDVERNGITAWEAGEEGSIAVVRQEMSNNRVLFTRYATQSSGEFYKQKPMKKGKGQVPLKSGDSRFADIDRYGGYDKDSTAYFFYVQHKQKKKTVRTLEHVPVRYAKRFEADPKELEKYCEQELKLSDFKILIPKIKMNTLFMINGFPMHISGRTGSKVTFKAAAQLVLDNESTAYVKRIARFLERKKNKTADKVSEFDGITQEQNLALYDRLTEKHRTGVYAHRPASQVETLENGRKKFEKLSVEEQCEVLSNILVLFRCVFARTDLKAIGGSKQAGTVSVNKHLSNAEKAFIVYQSPTGLYSQRIDLKSEDLGK